MNYVELNGTTSSISAGSDTGLDDLPTGAVTIEGWYRPDTSGEATFGALWRKGNWFLIMNNAAAVRTFMDYSTTDADVSATLPNGYEKWYHIALTYDEAGDRKARIWVNGALISTSSASAGTYVSDATSDWYMGNISGGIRAFDGGIGWVRVSNSVRYTDAFVPFGRDNPPLVDANTVALWKMNEGTGTAIDNAEGTAERDGTLSNVTWGSDVEERNRIWRPWSR